MQREYNKYYWAKYEGDLVVVEYTGGELFYLTGNPYGLNKEMFDWISDEPIKEPEI